MANTYTTNFNLAKPAQADVGWDASINGNFDTIDTALTPVIGCQKNNAYLVSADFPNSTTLYGWHINAASDGATIANWIGAKDLTRTGALTQQADHLGNSVYCEFDGTNDYLSSSDAAFGFSGNFSVSCWIYTASGLQPNQALVTRNNGSGYGWGIYTSDNLYFQTYGNTGNNTKAIIPYTSVNSGWHHICGVRSSTEMRLYVDGKWAASYAGGAPLSYTPGGNLEIGSRAGGGIKFSGRIAEVIVHDSTAWTEGEVRKLYARGARRFAALDANGTVQIPQNELVEYPIRPLEISSPPSGWSLIYAYGRPSKDILGNWYFEYWMRASFSTTNTGSFTINGITAKNVGQDQACAAYSSGGSVVSYCEVGNNSGVIYFGFSGSSTGTALMSYGKIMLQTAPSV